MSVHPEHNALSGLRDSMTPGAMPARTSSPGKLATLDWSLTTKFFWPSRFGNVPGIMLSSLIRKQGSNKGRKAYRQAEGEGGKVRRHAGRERRREGR